MPDKLQRIKFLQVAIEVWYKCDAKHLKTVWVDEKFQGASIWQGDVEVFSVTGHPKANVCYAWMHHGEDDNTHPVILLNKFPINSPETAVRASIALNASLNTDHPSSLEPPPAQLTQSEANVV